MHETDHVMRHLMIQGACRVLPSAQAPAWRPNVLACAAGCEIAQTAASRLWWRGRPVPSSTLYDGLIAARRRPGWKASPWVRRSGRSRPDS